MPPSNAARGEQVVAQFLRITSQPIPDLREHGLPADVAAVIERAMARDPTDRPASAAEFGEELRDVQRRNGVAVDEMAHPVDLGVEQRQPPVPPSTATSAHNRHDPRRRHPAPSTGLRSPPNRWSPVAG